MTSFSGFWVLFLTCLTLAISTVSVALPYEKREFKGRATWFDVGLGSCGKTNVNTDYIVALSPSAYAHGIHCDKKITITDSTSGVTATAQVRDTCPGCGPLDLDMSPALFTHFQSLSKGVFEVDWRFE